MAIAKTNTRTAFTGGAEELTCSPTAGFRRGVQIVTEGFTVDEATIEYVAFGGAEADEVEVTEVKHDVTIGDEYTPLKSITLSGLPEGEYFVTFTDLS
jgi:hypothetical protein